VLELIRAVPPYDAVGHGDLVVARPFDADGVVGEISAVDRGINAVSTVDVVIAVSTGDEIVAILTLDCVVAVGSDQAQIGRLCPLNWFSHLCSPRDWTED